MNSLLKGVGCREEDQVEKKITGNFRHPYAGSFKKIPEKYIHEDTEGDKQENQT